MSAAVGRWLGGVLTLASPFLVLGGCPASDNGGTSTGGAGGGAGSGGTGALLDGGDAEAWDPVWHETQPKSWPTVGPENNPDCGPGCRVALNVPIAHPPAYGPAYTMERVLGVSASGLSHANIGESVTWILPHPSDAPRIQISIWGDYVASARAFGIGDGQIELTNLVTGETKVAFRWTPAEAGTSGSELTALNDDYVFFIFQGFRARHRATGELTYLGPGACYSLCATGSALICESGRIYVIDPVSGKKQSLDDGTELQADGTCSADRKQYAWIDFRDPPGPGSDFNFTRQGGEVYFHDFETKKTRRATFDSPNQPRAKVYPAAGSGLLVWNEPPLSEPNPNPGSYGGYYGLSTALATLDLATGKRCQLLTETAGPLGKKSVHARHVYAEWLDKKANQTRVVDIDLDHPGFQWSCQDTPGWTK